MAKESQQELEQKHLDEVMDKIKIKEKSLDKTIDSTQGEARNLNFHYLDDVRLDYDDYSTSM